MNACWDSCFRLGFAPLTFRWLSWRTAPAMFEKRSELSSCPTLASGMPSLSAMGFHRLLVSMTADLAAPQPTAGAVCCAAEAAVPSAPPCAGPVMGRVVCSA